MFKYTLAFLFFLFCTLGTHEVAFFLCSWFLFLTYALPQRQKRLRHASQLFVYVRTFFATSACAEVGAVVKSPFRFCRVVVYVLFAMPLFLALFLGCTPKVVGEDVAPHRPSGALSPAHDAAELRYPASGKKIDKTLYYLNDPERMYTYQENFRQYLREDYDGTSEKYRNLQPRQISPFRQ